MSMDYPKLILIPLLVGGFIALLKIADAVQRHDLSWKTFTAYGGMPSFHTAFVVSITTVVGLADGVFSSTFAIAALFSTIVIRDAMGFRRYIGAQARVVNSLIGKRRAQGSKRLSHLEERVGHTPLEVAVGGVLGFVLSAILYFVIP